MTKRRLFYWIAGIAVALVGVGVVHVPSGQFAQDHKLLLMIVGTIFVFIGLYIITKGAVTYSDDAGPDGGQPPT